MSDDSTSSVLMAFTADQVARLTGLSQGQLRRWDTTGLLRPSFGGDDGSGIYDRIYTFRDVACLKILHALRHEHEVSVQELRKVKHELRHLGDDLWAKHAIHVLNKKVVIKREETGEFEEPSTGQGVVRIPLEVVSGNLQKDVDAMRQRDPNEVGRIEKERGHLAYRPMIVGTRIAVSSIKEFHDAGYGVPQIMREFPTLTREDVEAAIGYQEVA